jgi:hypothetical protein
MSKTLLLKGSKVVHFIPSIHEIFKNNNAPILLCLILLEIETIYLVCFLFVYYLRMNYHKTILCYTWQRLLLLFFWYLDMKICDSRTRQPTFYYFLRCSYLELLNNFIWSFKIIIVRQTDYRTERVLLLLTLMIKCFDIKHKMTLNLSSESINLSSFTSWYNSCLIQRNLLRW